MGARWSPTSRVSAPPDDVPAARGGSALRSWRIGRLAGVEIRMHPTFLVLVALAVVGFFGPPLAGLTWLALIFSCIVVHELTHAVVARRRGHAVRDIVLLPIGGASEIDRLPENPRDELAIAIAGPISSFVLGGALILTASLVHGSVEGPTLLAGSILRRLGWTNVLLGAFNLLPALPMDGGRVLRAALAQRHGIVDATERATAVSRWLAVALGVVGLLVMPWLLVIAFFVYVTGRTEATAVRTHERLAGVLVRDVMVPVREAPPAFLVTVESDQPVDDAVAAIVGARDDGAVVVDGSGSVVGILLLRQVAALLRRA
jgi:Zn-dependent protease